MSQNTGPVQAKSLSSQSNPYPNGMFGQGGGPMITSPMMGGGGGPGTPQPVDPTSPGSYYSKANPFAAAPVDTQEPINRQDRYMRQRMDPSYGAGGMGARLMTA